MAAMLTGMGGTGALMKSVSLFLSSGRRASAVTKPSGATGALPAAKHRKKQAGKKHRGAKKMAEDKVSLGVNSKALPKLIESLRKQTHFTRTEVEALCKIFKELVASCSSGQNRNANMAPTIALPGMSANANVCEGIDRVVFRELLHNTFDIVTEEVLMDRVFCAFDRCNDGVISLEEWIHGLSCFLRGTDEEKTAFAFFVYDLNCDGFISKEEMFHLLRNSLIKHPQDEDPDEGVKDFVDLVLKKMDYDRDGKVSFQDFKSAVTDEPLLLEAFGQCLPTDGSCQTFLLTLQS